MMHFNCPATGNTWVWLPLDMSHVTLLPTSKEISHSSLSSFSVLHYCLSFSFLHFYLLPYFKNLPFFIFIFDVIIFYVIIPPRMRDADQKSKQQCKLPINIDRIEIPLLVVFTSRCCSTALGSYSANCFDSCFLVDELGQLRFSILKHPCYLLLIRTLRRLVALFSEKEGPSRQDTVAFK